MGTFATTAKNTMLDALTIDRLQLHSGDPGGSGTSNALGSKVACVVNAASAGSRALNADVTVTGLTANQSVTHVSFWNNNGGSPIFLGSDDLSGDVTANSAGSYTVQASGTSFSL